MSTVEFRDFVEFSRFIGDLGFAPRTVVDIGVAEGTAGILDFPECYYVLVEPLVEFEDDLKRILETRRGEYHLCAAGDDDYRTQIRRGATIWDANLTWEPRPEDPEISVRRLDGLLRPEIIMEPALIKLDVQGHELIALDGLGHLLERFTFVILEVTLNPMKGPDVADAIMYMRSRGFVVFDIIGAANRPYDNALGQVDLVFVPSGAAIRSDKRWS